MTTTSDLLKELRIERGPAAANRKRRWPLWLGAAVLLLTALALFGRGRAITVETVVARSAAEAGVASVLDASGYVTARRLATVSSKVTGKVREVMIEEGQRVQEGEVLARLDDTDAAAQRALAQAQLASAQSQLAEAQAQLVLARANLTRQQELAKQKLVAASALDAATAEFDTRNARLTSLERSVAVARDQLAIAGIGVDNTVIRAPFSGVIVAKAAQPGEMISPISAGGGSIRTGIGTLVDMDSLEVQVDVNEAYIGRVTPKMPVDVVLNAYPDWKIPAEVIAIVPTADRSKATVKVRIALDSKDPRIVPDMGVRVSFLEERTSADTPPPSGALVPERAVLREGDQSVVFIVSDSRVQRTAVTLGNTRDADIEVSSGLKGGETLVLSPPKGLTDGARVRVATK